MQAEPWCYLPCQIAELTDAQVDNAYEAQADAVKQVERPPDAAPRPEPDEVAERTPFVRGGGQWDYLKSQGFSDEEAEAKIRNLRGE